VGRYELLYLFFRGTAEYLLYDLVQLVLADASGGLQFVGVQEQNEGGVYYRYRGAFELTCGQQGFQEGEVVYFGDAVLG